MIWIILHNLCVIFKVTNKLYGNAIAVLISPFLQCQNLTGEPMVKYVLICLFKQGSVLTPTPWALSSYQAWARVPQRWPQAQGFPGRQQKQVGQDLRQPRLGQQGSRRQLEGHNPRFRQFSVLLHHPSISQGIVYLFRYVQCYRKYVKILYLF